MEKEKLSAVQKDQNFSVASNKPPGKITTQCDDSFSKTDSDSVQHLALTLTLLNWGFVASTAAPAKSQYIDVL